MGQPDETVEFAGQRMRPDLVGDIVEIELMVDRLAEQSQWWEEYGPTAVCGCPLRVDGTEPYLHRPGCPEPPRLRVDRWLAAREQVGLRSDEVRCKLCEHGSESHRFADPVVCVECPEGVCQP